MGVYLEFDYMEKNEVCTHVVVYDDKSVSVTDYTEDRFKKAFDQSSEVTYEDVLDLFEERTIPRTRDDIRDILDKLLLKEYDPYIFVSILMGLCLKICLGLDFQTNQI